MVMKAPTEAQSLYESCEIYPCLYVSQYLILETSLTHASPSENKPYIREEHSANPSPGSPVVNTDPLLVGPEPSLF